MHERECLQREIVYLTRIDGKSSSRTTHATLMKVYQGIASTTSLGLCCYSFSFMRPRHVPQCNLLKQFGLLAISFSPVPTVLSLIWVNESKRNIHWSMLIGKHNLGLYHLNTKYIVLEKIWMADPNITNNQNHKSKIKLHLYNKWMMGIKNTIIITIIISKILVKIKYKKVMMKLLLLWWCKCNKWPFEVICSYVYPILPNIIKLPIPQQKYTKDKNIDEEHTWVTNSMYKFKICWGATMAQRWNFLKALIFFF